jgi:hypothetical protein
MVGEYWTPKENWKVYEFLAGSMTIVQEVPAPKNDLGMYGAVTRYQNDIALAEKVCAKVKGTEKK